MGTFGVLWAAMLNLGSKGMSGLLSAGRGSFKESLTVGITWLMEIDILFCITDAAA